MKNIILLLLSVSLLVFTVAAYSEDSDENVSLREVLTPLLLAEPKADLVERIIRHEETRAQEKARATEVQKAFDAVDQEIHDLKVSIADKDSQIIRLQRKIKQLEAEIADLEGIDSAVSDEAEEVVSE